MALTLLCAGCSGGSTRSPDPVRGAQGCPPAPLEIFLEAAEQLNASEDGRPSAVEVRVLLLRERELLDGLDFETVWKSGAEALAKDLVASASLTVFPGKTKIHPMKSAPDVGYVALVGIFRQPGADGWKHIIDVREQNRRCATQDELHTVVHALVRENRISNPE